MVNVQLSKEEQTHIQKFLEGLTNEIEKRTGEPLTWLEITCNITPDHGVEPVIGAFKLTK